MKNIEDVKIICRKCDQEMYIESSLNLNGGLFTCPICKEPINIKVK